MKTWICWLVILVLGSTLGVEAKSKEKKIKVHKDTQVKVHKDKHIKVSDGDDAIVYFTPEERTVFRKSLPPGLAKKVARGGELPPGWQKKIARGEVMPVTVYREVTPVPNDVLVLLPTAPPGTELVMIDGRVVRLHRENRTILDVFDFLD